MATHSSILAWRIPWTEASSFIHLFTSVGTHEFLFYFLHYDSLHSLFILLLKLSQIWTLGDPLSWVLCAFGMFLSF